MWQAVRRVLFWTYDRGSWQYDIIVLVILVFIFVSPQTLFDGTLLGRGPKAAGTPQVEAISVAAKPSPEPEQKDPAPGPKRPQHPEQP